MASVPIDKCLNRGFTPAELVSQSVTTVTPPVTLVTLCDTCQRQTNPRRTSDTDPLKTLNTSIF